MGKVYLINMINTDLYKIGYTRRDITKRINEIKTGNPQKIEVIHLFESKYHAKIETWMHNLHASKRMEGEWFELSYDDVMSFKENCQKGHDTFKMLVDSGNPFI